MYIALLSTMLRFFSAAHRRKLCIHRRSLQRAEGLRHAGGRSEGTRETGRQPRKGYNKTSRGLETKQSIGDIPSGYPLVN